MGGWVCSHENKRKVPVKPVPILTSSINVTKPPTDAVPPTIHLVGGLRGGTKKHLWLLGYPLYHRELMGCLGAIESFCDVFRAIESFWDVSRVIEFVAGLSCLVILVS